MTEGSSRHRCLHRIRLLSPLIWLGLSLASPICLDAQTPGPSSSPTAAGWYQRGSTSPQQNSQTSQLQPPNQAPPLEPDMQTGPGNPLDLTDHAGTYGLARYDWDGRQTSDDPYGPGFSIDSQSIDRIGKGRQDHKPLQFFGYDFFEPAREIIQARRLRMLGYASGYPQGLVGGDRSGNFRTGRIGPASQPGFGSGASESNRWPNGAPNNLPSTDRN